MWLIKAKNVKTFEENKLFRFHPGSFSPKKKMWATADQIMQRKKPPVFSKTNISRNMATEQVELGSLPSHISPFYFTTTRRSLTLLKCVYNSFRIKKKSKIEHNRSYLDRKSKILQIMNYDECYVITWSTRPCPCNLTLRHQAIL